MRKRLSLLFLLSFIVGSAGCFSLAGRIEAGTQSDDFFTEFEGKEPTSYSGVYRGAHYATRVATQVWEHDRVMFTGYVVLMSLDFPFSLALDTALLPIDLVWWAFSSDDRKKPAKNDPSRKQMVAALPRLKVQRATRRTCRAE